MLIKRQQFYVQWEKKFQNIWWGQQLVKYLSSLHLALIVICFYITGCASTVKSNTQPTHNLTTQNVFGYPFKVFTNWGKSNYYEYISSNEIILLKTFPAKSDDTANTFIANRLSLFQSVFEPKRVSYPGQHSRSIECPEKYKPRYLERKTTKGSLSYFLGYANKNKVAGACSDDLISYKHLYGMLYCKSTQTIIEIEYFTPINSNRTNSFVERISCEEAAI